MISNYDGKFDQEGMYNNNSYLVGTYVTNYE